MNIQYLNKFQKVDVTFLKYFLYRSLFQEGREGEWEGRDDVNWEKEPDHKHLELNKANKPSCYCWYVDISTKKKLSFWYFSEATTFLQMLDTQHLQIQILKLDNFVRWPRLDPLQQVINILCIRWYMSGQIKLLCKHWEWD